MPRTRILVLTLLLALAPVSSAFADVTAFIGALGPLRARLDYRVFNLKGEPLHSTVHRLYAGVNLAF